MDSAAYFQLDEQTEEKLEFYNGKVFPVEARTIDHALVSGNIYAGLRSALTRGKSKCQAFSSQLRIHIQAVNAYVYPNASIVCPPLNTVAEPAEAITNPILIAEVLSPSIESYDRAGNFTGIAPIAFPSGVCAD